MNMGRFFLFVTLLGLTHMLLAEPAVIFDGGNTQPLSDIYQAPEPIDPSTIEIDKEQVIVDVQEQMKGLKPTAIYPIESPGLSIGRVATQKVRLGRVFAPFFIIGDDAISRQWLQRNQSVLKKKNAQGLVAQVESEKKFNELAALVPDIRLVPFPATALAKAFGVKHYPVYIGPDRITQ